MTIATIITVIILLILLAFCQLCTLVMEYDPGQDQNPDSMWHKLIRSLNRWISDGEGYGNV